MVIAGFLGFYLTYIQSQKSLRDIAQVDMQEAARSVMNMIESKVQIAHTMNYAESMYFLQAGLRMDNFVNAWKVWWPLTLPNMMAELQTFIASMVIWPGPPRRGRLVACLAAAGTAMFSNFNSTVCNDTV
eukprot:RCo023628